MFAAVLTASLVGAAPAFVGAASPAPTTASARPEDAAISEEAKQTLELIGEEPFIAIENLLDTNYERNPGFPEPGRRYFFGVNAVF